MKMIQIEWDDEGYPTEESLELLEKMDWHEFARFVVFAEPENWNNYGLIERKYDTEEEEWLVTYATGGWSGNESILGSLSKSFGWFAFHSKWERGGYYEWRIPVGVLPDQKDPG